jgi:hypothetical protein
MIRIRLTRKLATVLNGLDVSGLNVGDIIELPDSAARMMVSERWAEIVTEPPTGARLNADHPPHYAS